MASRKQIETCRFRLYQKADNHNKKITDRLAKSKGLVTFKKTKRYVIAPI